MHPLLMLGVAAAGTYAVVKAKTPAAPEPPAVHPEIARAAAGLARSRMALGATPEQAAEWAAEKISERGGGFWKDKANGTVRF
jgi:hypothetical protein